MPTTESKGALRTCTGLRNTGCCARGKPSLIEDNGKPCCRACRTEAMHRGAADPWDGLPWLGKEARA